MSGGSKLALPTSHLRLRARRAHASPLALAAALSFGLIAMGSPAMALAHYPISSQAVGDVEVQSPNQPLTTSTKRTQDDVPLERRLLGDTIDFEAEQLEYDNKTDTIVARGKVVLRAADRSARADEGVWVRGEGRIYAAGNIRLVDSSRL